MSNSCGKNTLFDFVVLIIYEIELHLRNICPINIKLTKIQNNGLFSNEIPIQKGCCSSVYFLVIAEILALALRHNTEIEGITMNDIRNLLNQFADDMDIFSICKESSIKALFEELEKFKLNSGFTVSYEKTTMYRIGSLRHSNAQMYNMSQFVWSSEGISVLGVTIAHECILEKNYDTIISKAKNILAAWYNRGLSLLGKIQVVNTLIASLFVHKIMVLPMIPNKVIKNLDNLIREYIWNGKKAKIAYHILQNSKKEGGLNLFNLKKKEIALKATWPQILSKEEEYASMVYDIMRGNCLKENIWRCHLNYEDVHVLKIKNEFWKDVLQCWCQYNFFHNFRIENQILWYNSCIRINGKPFLWKDALQSGLLYVYQLFEDGLFKSKEKIYDEFKITTLRYNSLRVAIPTEWKNFFQSVGRIQFFPIPPQNYDLAITIYRKGLSQKVYRYISEDASILNYKYIKWNEDLKKKIL